MSMQRVSVFWKTACRSVLSALLLAATGCGFMAQSDQLVSGSPTPPIGSEPAAFACDRAPSVSDAETLIVLDFTGGDSRHAPNQMLSGFDFDALSIADPDAAAGMDADAFRRAVLGKVQSMLCALDPMNVAVIDGRAEDHPDSTVIHITGDQPGGGGKQIGQSDYDPCNRFGDDEAIIWAGAMARRIDSATYDQWTTAVANAITHEIGHTLGFFHPSEAELARILPGAGATEVMRKATSITELLSEQAFLIEQDTCTEGESYRLILE